MGRGKRNGVKQMTKQAGHFFTTKRSGSGTTMLLLRGQQVASAWFDKSTRTWAIFFVRHSKDGEGFKTFAEAERFAWLNFDKAA